MVGESLAGHRLTDSQSIDHRLATVEWRWSRAAAVQGALVNDLLGSSDSGMTG